MSNVNDEQELLGLQIMDEKNFVKKLFSTAVANYIYYSLFDWFESGSELFRKYGIESADKMLQTFIFNEINIYDNNKIEFVCTLESKSGEYITQISVVFDQNDPTKILVHNHDDETLDLDEHIYDFKRYADRLKPESKFYTLKDVIQKKK